MNPIHGKVLVAGGSGFVGRALAETLSEAGYEVVVLSRSQKPVKGVSRSVLWDGKTLGFWTEELEGARAIINLSGRSVAARWTLPVRQQILDSRVLSTQVIGQAIAACPVPPSVWINASAVGYYGDTGATLVDESTVDFDPDFFLAEVGHQWESAVYAEQTPQTRKVILRIGIVLGKDGGMFPRLSKLTEFFLGGAIGNGKQFISWIHLQDLVRLFIWCLENEEIEGPVNGVAPNPVTNTELMYQLRRLYRKPWVPPLPGVALKAFAPFINIEPELVLKGQRVLSKVALEKGFEFKFLDLSQALENLNA